MERRTFEMSVFKTVKNGRSITNFVAFQRRIIFSTILSATNAQGRRIDILWVSRHVGEFFVWLCEEDSCILSGSNAVANFYKGSYIAVNNTYSKIWIPTKGTFLVGLLQLLRSSGPRPSSPKESAISHISIEEPQKTNRC